MKRQDFITLLGGVLTFEIVSTASLTGTREGKPGGP
jgi:hypothetical protein